jgi:hypothetical protein
MIGQTPGHPGSVSWIPNQPPLVLSAGQQPGGPAFRGVHKVGQPVQHHAPSRRHRQTAYDRNFPIRPPNPRYPVGGNNDQAFNGPSGSEQGRPNSLAPPLVFNGIAGAGGWNQWSGAR